MATATRPKRHNSDAERMTFTPDIERCPLCGERLTAESNAAHSAKNVQTLTIGVAAGERLQAQHSNKYPHIRMFMRHIFISRSI